MTPLNSPRFVCNRHALLATAFLGVCSLGLAGTPDVVENFTSFQGVRDPASTSPNDTGATWVALGTGQFSTPSGFQIDPDGYNGKGITWEGAETGSIIGNADFVGTGPNTHQLAFTVKFERPTQPLSEPDIVQVVGPVAIDANLLGISAVNYFIAVGHTGGGNPDGILVYVPTTPLGTFIPFEIPAASNAWHKVVVQYEPAGNLISLNAKIRVWVDPTSGSDEPDVTANTGILGSFFGIGRLGRFAIGDATNVLLGDEAPGDVTSRVGSSKVKVDTMAGWYGTAETRAGSLGDAIAFFDSFGPASAVDTWTLY
jgi:hypothetical protein